MTDAASLQASLEAQLKSEIMRMYQKVVEHPESEAEWSGCLCPTAPWM